MKYETMGKARSAALDWLAVQDISAIKRAAVNELRARDAAAARIQAAWLEAVRRAKAAAEVEAARRHAEAAAEEEQRRRDERRAAELAAACEAVFNELVREIVVEDVLRGRDRPAHQHSKQAMLARRARARAKKKAKKKATKTQSGAREVDGAVGDVPTAHEVQLRREVHELRAKVREKAKLVKMERRRSRREARTAAAHARQSERRSAKAAKRKRDVRTERGAAGATRRHIARVKKRKVPSGEALHTNERKHQRLLAAAGSTGGGGARRAPNYGDPWRSNDGGRAHSFGAARPW